LSRTAAGARCERHDYPERLRVRQAYPVPTVRWQDLADDRVRVSRLVRQEERAMSKDPVHSAELLTQTGPGTPCGDLMRRYWQPIALARDAMPGSPPLHVRIMSEDLVLFRDDKGRLGLLGLQCPHRCADLSYGRVEDGGLRCIYHGWLFDGRGRCLEQPGVPHESGFAAKIRHVAYPCREEAGVIFAYLGGGEPPPFPLYEAFATPTHTTATKI